MGTKIVVAVDGSEHAAHAVEWCAVHAPAFGAEVIVVHAMEAPEYIGVGRPFIWLRSPSAQQRDERRERVARDWCKPLADAGVPFRVEVVDGQAVEAVLRVAREEDAALVVTGRRGLGSLREHIGGSTSHELTHCLDRPVVIVP